MRIFYIANARIPTEKAHGLQIMKTCEAFSDLGHEVVLFVPKRSNEIRQDPFEYYAVRKNFEIRYVATLDLGIGKAMRFLIQYMTFSLAVACARGMRSADLIYGRDELALLCLSIVQGVRPVWESHTGARNLQSRMLLTRLRKLVVISGGLKDFYLQTGEVHIPIVVAPDAVDLEEFNAPESKHVSRARLGLSNDKKIVLYIGRLDSWKGAITFCDSTRYLPADVQVVLIGGEPEEVTRLKDQYPNVTFLGYRPYRELPDNQAAADVLVLPNSSKTEVSSRFTSPLKLFTYMVSERPIVASDLPSIREVLNDRTAYFVTPDDPRALAEGIQLALADPSAQSRAAIARIAAGAYTWRGRAERILSSDIMDRSQD